MQGFSFNGVVAEPKARQPQENFTIPAAVQKELAALWERVGVKQKGVAYTAAILAFHRLTNEEQYAAMDQVTAARRRNDFRDLLRRDVGKTGDGPSQPDRSPEPQSTPAGKPGDRTHAGLGRRARRRERAR